MKSVAWSTVVQDNLIEGIKRRIVTGEKAMLGLLFFPKGAKVPSHTHESEQISNVLNGALKFFIDGEEIIVRSGETLVIPSNVAHSAEALEDTDDIDIFSPIRKDWLDGSDAYLRAQSDSAQPE